MPTSFNNDETPVIEFDLALEISAFLVFRRLKDGRPLALVDVRSEPSGYTLQGAETWHEGWEPPADRTVVFFDEDGSEAIPLAQRYQKAGHRHVKALFGGLELWKFSLDPQVVGEETFLIR